MSEPVKKMVGVVIKADGTVPFDDDCPDHIRSHILAHLVDNGHHVTPIPGTRHLKIQNWAPKAP